MRGRFPSPCTAAARNAVPVRRTRGRKVAIASPSPQRPYAATVYSGPKDDWVFNASTTWWGDGLSATPGYVGPTFRMADKSPARSPAGPDRRVQQMTRNLFDRFRSGK